MAIVIVPFSDSDADRWDAFVASSRNGTVFHTRKFLAYHPAGRFNDSSLMLMDGQRITGVLPAAITDEDGRKFLVSHPGASYGGLVLDAAEGMVVTGSMIEAVTDYAKKQNLAGIKFLRLSPQSVRRGFSDDQEYWMFQRGWKLVRLEMDGAVDLAGMSAEQIMPSLTGKCRNMVRQAERAEVRVEACADFNSFWPVLESALKGKHGAKPTHTLEEMLRLRELIGDSVRLFAGYLGEEMVAGSVVVTLNSGALYTLYMAQNYAHQKAHPMHAILVEVMKTAIREKRRVLHLGVSTEDGGTKVNPGLFFFKESFGCRPVRRESWELVF